jgi:hypothetical protein
MTSQLQVLYVVMNKPFKQLCSECLLTDEHAMTQLEESRCPEGNSFSVHYQSMKAHLTRNDCEGFYKCCISNSMNGHVDMS